MEETKWEGDACKARDMNFRLYCNDVYDYGWVASAFLLLWGMSKGRAWTALCMCSFEAFLSFASKNANASFFCCLFSVCRLYL